MSIKKCLNSAVIIFCLLSGIYSADAYVASSANYRLQSDSINVGGDKGNSTNYKIKDTVGEVAIGEGSSSLYKLKAGYQQMQESSISISNAPDIALTPLTITQNSAVGSSTWIVTTDNPAGYTVNVNASADPALVDAGIGESFTDYTETSPGVKETWSVSNAFEFGWSGIGNNVIGYGTDAESNCIDGADVPSSGLLWEGFEGTAGIQLASSASATPLGDSSTICVAVEQDTIFAPAGTYIATTTATAIVN